MPVDPAPIEHPAELARVPFVGRQAELARLARVLKQVSLGNPSLVLVDGPAGIGKTALIRHFLDIEAESCVLHGSGEESESSLAFGVLDQLIRQVPTSPSSLLAGSHDDKCQVDPLAAGATLIDLLGELQNAGSVVLVVDDVHWADRPSLLAITFALRRLRVDRVLAVMLTREITDRRLPDGLRRLLTDDHTLQLSLGGLDTDELRTLSGQLGTKPLSARGARRLHAHTGGSPLHARALLEQLPATAFDDAEVALPAPRSFALLVVSRLAACADATQSLTAAASVLGVRCLLHPAATLARLNDPLPALEQAIGAGLLVEEAGSGEIRFPHPLVHAAIYQDLGPVRRAALHAGAASLVKDKPAELRHRALAATGPDPTLATELAQLGRQQATRRAWAAAAEHLTAAARLTPIHSDYEQFILEAVECQLLGGNPPDAAELTQRLRGFAQTSWRSYALAGLALVAGRFDEAEALLGVAWQRCRPDTEPVLAAKIAGQLSMLHVLCARGQATVDWADLALRLAPEHVTNDLARFSRLVGRALTGDAEAALATIEDLPDPSVASLAELDTWLGRSSLRVWTDDLHGGHQDLLRILDAAHDRTVSYRVLASAFLAETEYRLGRWEDAVIHSELAVSIAVDAEQVWLLPYCHATAALIPAARGLWAQARAHLDAASASSSPVDVAAVAYTASAAGHLAAARGDPEQVIAVLQPLLALDSADGVFEPGIVPWPHLLVDALAAVGDYEQAEAVLLPFEAGAADRQRHSTMAAAARSRGNLVAAKGDTGAAMAAFQAGLDHAAQVDMPFDRAVLELAYGAFLRRAGKRRVAAAHLQAAQKIFVQLGARPYLVRCGRELAACGRTLTRQPVSDRALLTAQERAVARLVARGLTNRQIARELVVSMKTVEYHLTHVYTKLQVTSRVQLARQLGQD